MNVSDQRKATAQKRGSLDLFLLKKWLLFFILSFFTQVLLWKKNCWLWWHQMQLIIIWIYEINIIMIFCCCFKSQFTNKIIERPFWAKQVLWELPIFETRTRTRLSTKSRDRDRNRTMTRNMDNRSKKLAINPNPNK